MRQLFFAFGLCALAHLSPARGNAVLDWNAMMIEAIHIDNSGPTLSSRNLAILHVAIYDAVNSILRTRQPYQFLEDAPAGASVEAAVAGAGYAVVKTLYSPIRARAEDLYESYLASALRDAALTNGLNLGARIAELALANREADGANTEVPYIPSDAPGQWRRTPPFFRPPLTPQWRYVRLFGLPEADRYVPGPPPALDSPEYAAALNQVKEIGGKASAVRTAYQTETAVFWSDFSYTAMPPGHWHEITATICRQMGASLEDSARLFALISIAQADAAVVCWETKFRYNLWRPVTAILRAGEDGNPLTEADPSWDHLLAAPPFPSYTSGHSTFSKASAQVLTHFFGTDSITFQATSDSLPGVFREYTSLARCAEEVGLSRIYGGIHFNFDNAAGKRCGALIADHISANWFLANDELPALRVENLPEGKFEVRVHGHAGLRLILEKSLDLAQWAPVSTNTAVLGGAAALANFEPSGPQCYFRVREEN